MPLAGRRHELERGKEGRSNGLKAAVLTALGHPHLPDVFQDWGAESGFGGDLGLQ